MSFLAVGLTAHLGLSRSTVAELTTFPAGAFGLLMCKVACRRMASVITAANIAIHERIVIPRSSRSAIK